MTTGDALGYELIDFGHGRRLERFGRLVLDRPDPGATGRRALPEAWAGADACFERDRSGGRWSARGDLPESWEVDIDGLTLEVRPAASGQVGVFPEHEVVADWAVRRAAAASAGSGRPARVLNLFAGTGLVTLALARAGSSVSHVDASRPAIARARANAERSGLAGAPTRWIVDDAVAFAEREARRAQRYDGAILDPPTYGHGPTGRAWVLDSRLHGLIATVVGLLADGGFLAVTAHARKLDERSFAAAVGVAIDGASPTVAAPVQRLGLETADGRRLPAGWAALVDLT